MGQGTKGRWWTVAMVLSELAFLAAFFWYTAPDEPKLRRHQTNPYLVVGLPALAAAAAAWVGYFVARRRSW